MSTLVKEKDFEKIYQNTYQKILKFIVIKCNNIDDINDILQDTYIELLKKIKRKKLTDEVNIESYLYGIASNVIKRYYYKKKKDNTISFYSNIAEQKEIEIKDDFDLEQDIITKENVEEVWNYVKEKDLVTSKIFYLYFVFGMKIKDISKELTIGESNVKNKIYRTLKELKKYLGK